MQVTKVIITNTLLYFSMSMPMTMAKSNAIIVHKFQVLWKNYFSDFKVPYDS